MRQRASRNDGDAGLPGPGPLGQGPRPLRQRPRALYVRGIRVEVCPYNTLFWRPEFEYSDHDMGNLTQEEEWTYAMLLPPEIEDMAKPLEKDAAEALRVRRQLATAGDD